MAGAEGLSKKMWQRVESSMGGAPRYLWRRLATPRGNAIKGYAP